IAQRAVAARDIILSHRIVRVDGQCSGEPLPGTLYFAQLNQCRSPKVRRPGILRVQNQFALRSLDPLSCSSFAVSFATKRPVYLNQEADRLIIVWPDFGRALEKTGRLLNFAVYEAGARSKVIRLK